MGVVLQDADGKVSVKEVDRGSLAEKNGVNAGDVIVKVGAETTASLNKAGVIGLIKSVSRPFTTVFEKPETAADRDEYEQMPPPMPRRLSLQATIAL